MSNGEITMTKAIVGIGNSNHDHVHRHNQINMDSNLIDILKTEQMAGGIRGTTMNSIASLSGGLTAQPQGYVSVEDGFNHRRGIALLGFVITGNSMASEELSVVGYLTGGQYSEEGIDPATMFVPVRAWKVLAQNTADPSTGFPMVRHSVVDSHQFLMGDPNLQKNLKAIRPMDVANEALGYLITESEGMGDVYEGTIGTDLNKSMVLSKTVNLNPTHHARELLQLATVAGIGASLNELEREIADNLQSPGINEIGPSENDFIRMMQHGTGSFSLNGFQGFSFGEILDVFRNLLAVMDLRNLNTTRFATDDTLLTSSQYGTASAGEVVCSELAFLCVHLLLQTGLSSVQFSATNNPNDFSGLHGSDDGVAIIPGPAMSMLDHDQAVQNRVEDFFRLIKNHFFAKHTNVHAYNRTIMNVQVESHMFGETVISVFFNGDPNSRVEFTNATYMINRTSTNISGSEIGMQQSKNYINNIKDYFI